jgi:hypothetical protein
MLFNSNLKLYRVLWYMHLQFLKMSLAFKNNCFTELNDNFFEISLRTKYKKIISK